MTFEDTSVGGSVRIAGMQTCWLGFFRTTVNGNVRYHENSTFSPDGNEVDTNVVQGNLACNGDNPAAQVGDSFGFPNVAFGKATAECASLSGPSSQASKREPPPRRHPALSAGRRHAWSSSTASTRSGETRCAGVRSSAAGTRLVGVFEQPVQAAGPHGERSHSARNSLEPLEECAHFVIPVR